MKRVLCIWFPNWTIQCRLAAQPRGERGRALVVHALAGGKSRVVACSRGACLRGVKAGMLLVEAQALWPAAAENVVRFEPHDPFNDREELRELARRCQQFSPTVAIDDAPSPDCLLLDATGFGQGRDGEEGFAGKVAAWFQRRGYQTAVVIADTVGAAWAAAHYGIFQEWRSSENRPDGAFPSHRTLVVASGQHGEILRTLPVEALRLPEPIIQTLHELNLFRIDQVLALPRRELPSRFGVEILRQIDRALGTIPEMLVPEPLIEPLEACWQFEFPVADCRILDTVIEHSLERLLKQIDLQQFGVQRLVCSLKLAGHEPVRCAVELLRPSPSQRDLMELVRLQFERLRLPAEVAEVTLGAAVILPLEFHQDALFGGGENSQERQEAAALLERLHGRLGEHAVLRPSLRPDIQPEFAYRYESLLNLAPGPPSDLDGAGACRPAFLKNRPDEVAVVATVPGGPPQLFHWNKRQHLVERSWGPERMETGWWRDEDVRRDYFIVETDAGERFWLFHNLNDGSWRLHGAFV